MKRMIIIALCFAGFIVCYYGVAHSLSMQEGFAKLTPQEQTKILWRELGSEIGKILIAFPALIIYFVFRKKTDCEYGAIKYGAILMKYGAILMVTAAVFCGIRGLILLAQ